MSAFNKKILMISLGLLIILGIIISFSMSSHSSDVPVKDSPVKSTVLGENNRGKVEKLGPFGNVSSSVQIAYIIGVHYRENKSHQAVYENIVNKTKSLKHCYYIYKITVNTTDDYVTDRERGQHLARDFIVADIKKQNYQLVIDVHSYKYARRFVFVPGGNEASKKIAWQLVDNLKWLSYYSPPNQSSPYDVTIPIIDSGTPAIIFENYKFQSYNKTYSQASEFIETVDKLKF